MKSVFMFLLLAAPFMVVAQKDTKTKQSKTAVTKPENAKKEEKFEPINLWFVMLMKGPNRTQDSTTAAQLQAGHMANMDVMAKAGKLLVAGPFMEDANWRGISIIKCDSKEEAEMLVKKDPAILAGKLSYEIHPWMTGKNCLFK